MVAILRGASTTGVQRVIFSRDGDATVEQGLHRFEADRDYEFVGVIATAGEAPVGDFLRFDVVVDAFDGGGSVYDLAASKPTIAAGAHDDVTSAPDRTELLGGHYFTVDIINVGSTTPGSKIDVGVLIRPA